MPEYPNRQFLDFEQPIKELYEQIDATKKLAEKIHEQAVKDAELQRLNKLHSFHSILDGCGSIDNYIKLAKENNHSAMAITDHGTLSGTFEFWKKCKAAGIKPIIGMEAYVNNTMGDFEEKKHEGGNSHQSILVMNRKGFVNINYKIVFQFCLLKKFY